MFVEILVFIGGVTVGYLLGQGVLRVTEKKRRQKELWGMPLPELKNRVKAWTRNDNPSSLCNLPKQKFTCKHSGQTFLDGESAFIALAHSVVKKPFLPKITIKSKVCRSNNDEFAYFKLYSDYVDWYDLNKE